MSRPACWHCGASLTPAELDDEAGALSRGRGHLCGECTDLAVWGALCSACEHPPARYRCQPEPRAPKVAGAIYPAGR